MSFQTVVIPFLSKMVVGMAVSKIVGGITGNQLLGALAGGLVGGGLNFSESGFTWSLENAGINTAGEGLSNQGMQLAGVTPETSSLLSSTQTIAGVDGAAGNLVEGAVGSGGLNPAITEAGAAMGSSAPTTSVFGTALPGAGTAGSAVGDALKTSSGLDLTKAAGAATSTAEGAGKGFLDKALGFVNDNPEVAKMGFSAIQNAMTPDEIEVDEAKMQNKASFQSTAGDGLQGLSRDALPDNPRSASLLANQLPDSQYSKRVLPHYQQIIDEIRSRRTMQEVA